MTENINRKPKREKNNLYEKGFISVTGVVALSILTFLGATLYAVGMSRRASVNRFLARSELQNAAEDIVILARAKMNEDESFAVEAERAVNEEAKLFSENFGEAQSEVYARRKGETVILLGTAKKDGHRARAVAVTVKKEGKYLIDHWEY